VANSNLLNLINTTTINRDANGNTLNQNGFNYTYNPYNRLTSVTQGVSPSITTVGSYQYNALGQRLAKTISLPTTSTYLVTRKDLRSLKNALRAAGRNETLSTVCTSLDTWVDNELNQFKGGNKDYRADAQQLVDQLKNCVLTEAKYNSVKQTILSQADTGPTNSTTTFTFGLGGELLSETNTTTNTQKDYVYLNGKPLAMIVHTDNVGTITSQIYTIHNDHLGTPQAMTNASGIYRSNDRGVTWSSMNTGLGHFRVNAINSNQSLPETLSAGTLYGGIYSYTSFVDTNPDTFTFKGIKGAELNTLYVSNEITVSSVEVAVPISISGGEYSINGGTYTSVAGTVVAGDRVRVRTTSSKEYATRVTALLTISRTSGAFIVETYKGPDSTPDRFKFRPVYGAEPGKFYISNEIIVTGINMETPVTISQGRYSINGAPFNARITTLKNGDRIRLIVRAWNKADAENSATITIGGVSGTFLVDTGKEDKPDPK